MIVKSKRIWNSEVLRLKSEGELKEIKKKKVLGNPGEEMLEICFKGEKGSGIIELGVKEAKELVKLVNSKIRKK